MGWFMLRFHNIRQTMTVASRSLTDDELAVLLLDVPALGSEHLLYRRAKHANVSYGMATAARDDLQRLG